MPADDGGVDDLAVPQDLAVPRDVAEMTPPDRADVVIDMLRPTDFGPRCPQPCGDAGSCDVDLGMCRGCRGDVDCGDPKAPVCDRDTGLCQPCTPGSDVCPPGRFCLVMGPLFTCAPGCKIDFDCFAGRDAGMHMACCDHQCIDTWLAADHCGGCGKACGQGASCCSGACADATSDVKNCGACGNVCPSMNDVPACQNGKCATLGCNQGFSDCDQDPKNGCEVATDSDVGNCGVCGSTCKFPNATPACVAGKCSFAACVNGFLNCNGQLQDGCELDGNADGKNCGACDNVCGNMVHAVAACVASKCVVSQCDPGYGDCNKMGNDGCEAVLASDVLHCNGCGNACPPPPNHVGAVCVNGVCGAGGCQGKYADCDNSPNNGCESDTTSDTKNCGGCGAACPVNMPMCKNSAFQGGPPMKIGHFVNEGGAATRFGTNLLAAFPVTLVAGADLVNFGFYPMNVSNGRVTMALYSDVNKAPAMLVAATASTAVGPANQAQEIPPAMAAHLNAGTYWLAFMTDDPNLLPAYGKMVTDYYLAMLPYGAAPQNFPMGMAGPGINISWDYYITVQ